MRKLPPVTPGELLLEEFLKPMGISQYRLAKEIGVPPQRIGEIVAGSAPSPPTPTCDFAAFLGCRTAIGSARRLSTIRKLLTMRWPRRWPPSSLGAA